MENTYLYMFPILFDSLHLVGKPHGSWWGFHECLNFIISEARMYFELECGWVEWYPHN